MKITVISGSPREKSLTRKLALMAYEYAKSKYLDVEYLDLGKTPIEPFAGYPHEFQYNKHTLDTVKVVESSQVLIVCAPIYDSVFSSAVKNLFEHVNYKMMEGAVAGFIVKSSNPPSFRLVRSQLMDMMSYFNILSNPRAVFSDNSDFDEREEMKNPEIKGRIAKLVDETVALKR